MSGLARILAVVLAALGLGGASDVGRVPPRVAQAPAKVAHLPAGVRSIEIHGAIGMTNVTDRASVKQIVKWFRGLPRFRPLPCPYTPTRPADVRFNFRGANGTSLLRAVDHEPGICGSSVTVSTGGRASYATLADAGFVSKVEEQLDVYFDANKAKTDASKSRAKRAAARILPLASVPPGSRRVPLKPDRAVTVDNPQATFGLSRAWTVAMPIESVNAFEEAHPPKGSHVTEQGSGGRWGVITSENVVFSFPAQRGIGSRSIDVTMTRTKTGLTRVVVSATATWNVARAADELVPRGVTTIEIYKVPSSWFRPPKTARRLMHRVTDRRTVARIIHWFDALPRVFSGPTPPICSRPANWGRQPSETITFLDASGDVLAQASADSYGTSLGECDPITFTIAGHATPPPLLLGNNFLPRVERLLR